MKHANAIAIGGVWRHASEENFNNLCSCRDCTLGHFQSNTDRSLLY